MAKRARIELRVDEDLKARVEALAAERGQTLTVFAERALETALSASGPPIPEIAQPDILVPNRNVTAPSFNRVKTLKR